MIGLILDKKEKFDEAIYYFLRAHNLNKDDIDTLITISNFYILRSDFNNSIIHLNKIRYLIKDEPEIINLIGLCYINIVYSCF